MVVPIPAQIDHAEFRRITYRFAFRSPQGMIFIALALTGVIATAVFFATSRIVLGAAAIALLWLGFLAHHYGEWFGRLDTWLEGRSTQSAWAEYEFSSAGVTLRGASASRTLPWRSITQMEEFAQGYVLSVGRGRIYILKRWFSDEADHGRFEHLVRMHVGSRAKLS